MRPGTSARSLHGRIARLEVRQAEAVPEITAEDLELAERIAARWGLEDPDDTRTDLAPVEAAAASPFP